MILPFQTHFYGRPNLFVDKILAGFEIGGIPREVTSKFYKLYLVRFPDANKDLNHTFSAKLHTFREDPKNRWKPGTMIHPVIGMRTKNQFQFAPPLACKSVQPVFMMRDMVDGFCAVVVYGKEYCRVYFDKDKEALEDPEYIKKNRIKAEAVAINDGFDSFHQMANYFLDGVDFWQGKIIHWTNLQY